MQTPDPYTVWQAEAAVFAPVALAADSAADEVLTTDRLAHEDEARELLGPDPC